MRLYAFVRFNNQDNKNQIDCSKRYVCSLAPRFREILMCRKAGAPEGLSLERPAHQAGPGLASGNGDFGISPYPQAPRAKNGSQHLRHVYEQCGSCWTPALLWGPRVPARQGCSRGQPPVQSLGTVCPVSVSLGELVPRVSPGSWKCAWIPLDLAPRAFSLWRLCCVLRATSTTVHRAWESS